MTVPDTPFPRGWYVIATSDELDAGSAIPLRVFGVDLVAAARSEFRDGTG